MTRRVILGLVLLLPAAPAFAAPILRYQSLLSGDPPLGRPISVAADVASAEICVTDQASRTINVFDDHGLHRFRTDELAGLSTPVDACIDSRGGFVLTDLGADRRRTIRRLTFFGEPDAYEPESPRDGWNPGHLLLTRDGNYVTVDGVGLLAKHDARTGALLWTRQLVEPDWERADLIGRPAEAPDGRLYVPSAGTGFVFIVEADGSDQTAFGRRGTKRGEMAFPVGVAFAPDGKVLVLDKTKHCVNCYAPDHRFVAELGRFGLGTGELYFPESIAVLPDGRVFIGQGFQGRVQVYRLEDPAAEGQTGARDGSAPERAAPGEVAEEAAVGAPETAAP